jgi:hypothetical protein
VTAAARPLRDRLLTMSRKALRLVAGRWFLAGFKLSGRGMNGETADLDASPATRRLLMTEFARLWTEDSRREEVAAAQRALAQGKKPRPRTDRGSR